LDAVTELAGQDDAPDDDAQVRILEVGSLRQIREAVTGDAYHVLHLSAHGSRTSVELEDEDGDPVPAGAVDLIDALRHAGRQVPLILLSACSGGPGGADTMAAGLISRGADRVIAMQAPVTDGYATRLAGAFYRELAHDAGQPVAQLLARARLLAEEETQRAARAAGTLARPEYAVATLLCSSDDVPLLDPGAERQPLTRRTAAPPGGAVREVTIRGSVGRRGHLRRATAGL